MLEGNIGGVRFLSYLNDLVFVLEENLTQAEFIILYNVVFGNMLVFSVDINLVVAKFLTLECFYVLEFVLKGNLTHVRFYFKLQCCNLAHIKLI